MFLKKIYFPLALSILLFSIVSCQPNYDSEAYLESTLNPNNCSLPCWNGFVPDETSETELWEYLESQPANKADDLRRIVAEEVIIEWRDRELGGYHVARFDEHHLKYFNFNPRLDIYMDEVISVIGTPDSYLATAGTTEAALLSMHFFYEKLGVHIVIFQQIDYDLERKLNACQASISASESLVVEINITPRKKSFVVAEENRRSVTELQDWPTNGELFLTKCYQE